MLEAPDIEVVADYLRRHYVEMCVESVRCSPGYEYVAQLAGTKLIEAVAHGKFLFCTWELEETFTTEEGVLEKKKLHSQIALMTHGRIYDTAKHTQRDGHYWTLRFTGGNLTMFDHTGSATCSVTDKPTERTGVCIVSGKLTDEDLETQCPAKRRGCLAGRLLLQERIVGMGPLVGTEVLAVAKIHPKANIRSLTSKQRVALLDALNDVPQAIAACGGYKNSRPVSPDGSQGFYVPDTYATKEKCTTYTISGGRWFTRLQLAGEEEED